MIKIRTASQKDIEQIKQLYRETVIAVNSKDYTEEQIRVWSDVTGNSHSFSEKITEQNFFVAEFKNIIVGFSSITNEGYLDYMYVHKDFLRKGIAKKLLKEIERTAIEFKVKKITSHVSITAQPFFEKFDYLEEGKQTEIYRGVKFINSIMVKHNKYF